MVRGGSGWNGARRILLRRFVVDREIERCLLYTSASDEINYRRFFDVNDLAGLRIEEPAVFDATHRLVLELVAQGKVDGLRLDHPDGLYDPAQYFHRLQQTVGGGPLEPNGCLLYTSRCV